LTAVLAASLPLLEAVVAAAAAAARVGPIPGRPLRHLP